MFWSTYRRLWWMAVLGAVAYGVLFAALRLSLPELWLIGGGMAVQGVLYGWLVGDAGSARGRWLLGAGLLYSVPTLAMVGLVLALGFGSLVTVAALGLGGLPLLRRRRQPGGGDEPLSASAGAPGRGAGTGGEPVAGLATVDQRDVSGPPPVSTLSTAQVCRAWQVSHRVLQHTDDPVDRQALVGLRADLLDELESRNPCGFARWLADAQANPDPTPFFSPAAHP